MKKVVSIALFGDATRKDGSGQNYHAYLQTFVLAHANLFPREQGWALHVHIDDTTLAGEYGRILARMKYEGLLELATMGAAVLTHSMLWRMAPVFEPGIDYVFCRDIDCIPMPRDRAVCDVFIASNCAAGVIHDSSSHTGIMGGLCHFQTAAFKNATKLSSLDDLYMFAAKSEREWAQHGTDQHVLNRLIDRPDGPTLLEHRYNGWHAGPGKYPARKAGVYRCRSWSSPMPDKGKSWFSHEAQMQMSQPPVLSLLEQADLLANHLGAAGYEIERARAFWEQHGDPTITKLVKECES
ncbi:MAG: hypothetical protein V4550_18325 [Gemmatimonadota bacterium]